MGISNIRKKYTIQNAKDFAFQKNGQCLSETYKNNLTPMLWKCNVCDHEWWARFGNIKTGYWCPECGKRKAADKRRLTMDDMHALAKKKEGACLSKKYISAKDHLQWQCKEGHVFSARPYNVGTGHWCPKCADKKVGLQKREYTFEMVEKEARLRGGMCLSLEYNDGKCTLELKCGQCRHQWKSLASRFYVKKSWCLKCAYKSNGEKLRKYSIEDCHELAKSKNGEFLSEFFDLSNRSYIWKCEFKNHPEFNAILSSVLAGHWCPACGIKKSSDKQRGRSRNDPSLVYSIEYLQKFGDELNLKLISREYINYDFSYLWECKLCGYVRSNKIGNLKRSTPCPRCSGRVKTRQDMVDYAEDHGGKFLSEDFNSQPKNMKWLCNNGHVFYAPYNMVSRGGWCTVCNHSYGEKITRGLCEVIFNKHFKKIKPEWLRLSNTRILELDGYCEELKIAFEYQGQQHYRPVNHWGNGSSFKKIKKRDKIKKVKCIEAGVALIVVRYFDDLSNLTKIIDCVETSIRNAGIKIPLYTRPQTFGQLISSDLTELHNIANSRGGELVSDAFLGWTTNHTWRCKNGHEWVSKPAYIRDGSWCYECARENFGDSLRLTMNDVHETATLRNCICLSSAYYKNSHPLKWQCNVCDYQWSASLMNLRARSGCPQCGRLKSSLSRRKYDIDSLRKFAQGKGGDCLSEEYFGIDKNHIWCCKKGHEWEAAPNNIINRGTWCAACSKKKKKTIDDMHALADGRLGQCLSSEYLGAHKHLLWKCEKGHKFKAMPTNVQQGKWCSHYDCRYDRSKKK